MTQFVILLSEGPTNAEMRSAALFAVGVLVGDEVVRDGLEKVSAHLGVEGGNQPVREVIVGVGQHLVCVLEGGKQGIDGGTGFRDRARS